MGGLVGSQPAFSAAAALGLELEEAVPCLGGDINLSWKLSFAGGGEAFLKSRADAPHEEFQQEAAGLRWLAEAGGMPVPRVLAVLGPDGPPGLLLEWIEPGGRLDAAGEEAFGRGLAATHRAGAGSFGEAPGMAGRNLHVGPVDLGDCGGLGHEEGFGPCYARRLDGLVRQALDRDALTPEQADVIVTLCERIEELAGPPEPPARTHGDLWSGNVMVSADGRPHLIDPAAHGAHRELDLAMLALFGAPSDRFYGAYKEEFPLEPEYRDRIDLWQVQPLLIHAVLFGGSYGAASARAAGRYV